MTALEHGLEVHIGPQVPYDPELGAPLAAINEFMPAGFLSAEASPLMRQDNPAPVPSLEDLSLNGLYRVEERQVPGPADAPDISLLICSPATTDGPVPVIYHTHGGGNIVGTNRTGIPQMLEQFEDLPAAMVSVEYRLAPETPHPGPVGDCYAGPGLDR